MRRSYHDIKAEVLARIRDNTWPPGAGLPGEIELAQEFGCARATVNRAMQDLVSQGILERRRKAGTWVKASPTRKAELTIPLIREEIAKTGATYRYALVERDVLVAPGWLRAQVDLDPETEVLRLRCMHFASNRPYQLEDRWINLAAIPDARHQSFADIGPNDWLLREVPFSDVEMSFSAQNAVPEVADYLDIAAGDAVFVVERTTWLDQVNVTHARLYHGQGYKMTTRF